jgi:hypothetical protein
MEGQVPVGWSSGRVDAGVVSSGVVRLHFRDTSVQHPDVRGGDSVCVVECGRPPSQVLALHLHDDLHLFEYEYQAGDSKLFTTDCSALMW